MRTIIRGNFSCLNTLRSIDEIFNKILIFNFSTFEMCLLIDYRILSNE